MSLLQIVRCPCSPQVGLAVLMFLFHGRQWPMDPWWQPSQEVGWVGATLCLYCDSTSRLQVAPAVSHLVPEHLEILQVPAEAHHPGTTIPCLVLRRDPACSGRGVNCVIEYRAELCPIPSHPFLLSHQQSFQENNHSCAGGWGTDRHSCYLLSAVWVGQGPDCQRSFQQSQVYILLGVRPEVLTFSSRADNAAWVWN